jgi:C_GCAxxG_C_C family probable redox protein
MWPSKCDDSRPERFLYKPLGRGENRRRFLVRAGKGVAVGLGALCLAKVRAAETLAVAESRKPSLTDTDAKKIIEEAYRIGYDYEKKHGGCARCTVAALQDAVEFIPVNNDIFAAAGCLDGGATPSGVQNCGAFTGAGIVIGYLCGRNRDRFKERKELSHKLIREVYQKFKENYGTVLCKDVREKMERYPDKCPRVVGNAAAWTAEAILQEFRNDEQVEEGTP